MLFVRLISEDGPGYVEGDLRRGTIVPGPNLPGSARVASKLSVRVTLTYLGSCTWAGSQVSASE
jgi:hypothetical protein